MVVFDLIFKIVSENIKEIKVDPETFTWGFCIQCSHCHTEQPNEIYFTLQDEEEMQKGHGTANFVMKCKDCKKLMTIAINNKTNKNPYTIECTNGNDEATICSFECRGCTILKWVSKSDFIVVSNETETEFEGVDITDLWSEYDEKSGLMLNILEPSTYKLEEQ